MAACQSYTACEKLTLSTAFYYLIIVKIMDDYGIKINGTKTHESVNFICHFSYHGYYTWVCNTDIYAVSNT